MKEHKIHIDHVKCIGCGLCRQDCPADNIAVVNKKAVIKSQSCIFCGHCVAICPKSAVSITGFGEPPVEIARKTVLDPNELLHAIRMRRSIRKYKNQPVENEVIAKIIEAGRLTPTAKNAQDISYIVLKDKKEKCEKIAVRFFRKMIPITKLVYPAVKNIQIDDHFFFFKAPVAIIILSDDTVSGSLAASNMALMAEACGLGVLYSGFFTRVVNRCQALRKVLQLKKSKAVTTLVIGYPNATYYRTPQRENAAVRYL